MDQVHLELKLPKVPYQSTLQCTFKKLSMVDFEKIKNQLEDEQSVDEDYVASYKHQLFAGKDQSVLPDPQRM